MPFPLTCFYLSWSFMHFMLMPAACSIALSQTPLCPHIGFWLIFAVELYVLLVWYLPSPQSEDCSWYLFCLFKHFYVGNLATLLNFWYGGCCELKKKISWLLFCARGVLWLGVLLFCLLMATILSCSVASSL